MKLVFIHGGAASGKLTVARALAALTGYGLFHNHLVVDAVLALFDFNTEPFVRLRELFWMEAFEEAAKHDRSLIFTFAPERSVACDFPERVRVLVERHGGELFFVRLTVDRAEQERRIDSDSRAEFRKLRSLDLLRELHAQFLECEAAMPASQLTLDTTHMPPAESARQIVEAFDLLP